MPPVRRRESQRLSSRYPLRMKCGSHTLSLETSGGIVSPAGDPGEPAQLIKEQLQRRLNLQQVCHASRPAWREWDPEGGCGDLRATSLSSSLFIHSAALGAQARATAGTSCLAPLSFLGFRDMWSHLLGGAMRKNLWLKPGFESVLCHL